MTNSSFKADCFFDFMISSEPRSPSKSPSGWILRRVNYFPFKFKSLNQKEFKWKVKRNITQWSYRPNLASTVLSYSTWRYKCTLNNCTIWTISVTKVLAVSSVHPACKQFHNKEVRGRLWILWPLHSIELWGADTPFRDIPALYRDLDK